MITNSKQLSMKLHLVYKLVAFSLVFCIFFGCKPEEEKLGAIYGTVTDYATGDPVGNANVKLRPSGETTLTGSDGTFEFNDLKADKYSLLITKAEYADLDDDYIIELEAGKKIKRDVQIRRRMASLQITDMAGNPLDTLDFGDQESVRIKTFNVFNDGTEILTCTVTYDCEWITNVGGLESQIQPGKTVPVTVKIDRVALNDGDNSTFLYITSANGSNELVIKATFKGTVVINTKNATEVGSGSATVGGNITDDGGRPVTARGVCYGTSQSPDINGLHTEDGSGTGEFSHNITGLSASTTYYARAYATNRNGTYYASNIVSFTTTDGLPTVTTASVTNITATTAKCGGNVTNNGGHNVTARGVCWNTMGSPDLNDPHTTNGNGNGAFTSNITDLVVGSTYYVRAYATNSEGTSYGDEVAFTTIDGLPVVTTKNVTNIAPLSASGGGVVTTDNGFSVTTRGICWSTVSNPTINDAHTTNGTGMGEFNSAISGLQNSTTYHVRAYATNSKGTAYGEDKLFTTTSGTITVTTSSVTGAGPSGATCGGNATVTGDNNLPITAKGVCWGTGHNPTVSNSHTNDGTGPGAFTSTISGLAVNTLYYVRAYAINQLGTYYGDEKSFTTTVGLPVVTTTEPTLSGMTVTTGGNVTSDGGYSVTARGICYGPLPNPDLSSTYQHTTDGTGTGYFSSTFSLPGGSGRYYIRAYATNDNGTVYGEQKSIIQPYDELPSFQFNGYTYRVAPEANNTLYWSDANNYCENLTLYGYSDWKLPTKEELLQMYNDRESIGGFSPDFYWSCTQFNSNSYMAVSFQSGVVNSFSLGYDLHVRPIRQENGGGTTPVLPIVTTSSPTSVAASSATCGGNVTSDGGATVTQRGVCYSTSPNPTTSSQTVSGGSGTGSFTCSLTGLSTNTTYYVRAYAINSAGTAYGNQENFTTQSGGGGGQTFTFTFESGTEEWYQIDADGDGYTWERNGVTGAGHNGSTYFLVSASYVNDKNAKGPLTPDNYLYTPQRYSVSNGASISFYVRAQDASWAAEHYGVAVATVSGNPNASDFTTIWEETLTAKTRNKGGSRGTNDSGAWYLKTIDLSAYAGQAIWIAIRHFNCTDQFMINVDDITIKTSD